MFTFFFGFLLPWGIFFAYLILCQKFPEQLVIKGQKKIWVALTISYPFFVWSVYLLAKASFKHNFFPYYIITVILILLLLIGVHLFFFKEIIWLEYLNMSIRIIIQITIVMQLFFSLTTLCQSFIHFIR